MKRHIVLLEAIPNEGSLSIAGRLLLFYPEATVEQFAWANFEDIKPGDWLYLVREPLLRACLTEVYSPSLGRTMILNQYNLLPLLILKGLRYTGVNICFIGPMSNKKATKLADNFPETLFSGTTIKYFPTGCIPTKHGFTTPKKRELEKIIPLKEEPLSDAIFDNVMLLFQYNFRILERSFDNLPKVVDQHGRVLALAKLEPDELMDLCKDNISLTLPFWKALLKKGKDYFFDTPQPKVLSIGKSDKAE